MAGLLDFLQGLDGGQPNAGLMQAPAPQGNIMDAIKSLVMNQGAQMPQQAAPQGMLLGQMQQAQQPQMAPQAPPQQAPMANNNNTISAQIQQMVGAQTPPQPNTASNILSARFNNNDDSQNSLSSLIPSMQDMNQAAQSYSSVPNAQDYLSSLGHIGTNQYQTANDIAGARTQDIMKQLSSLQALNLEKQKIDQGRFQPVKDVFGNVTGVINGKTGEVAPLNSMMGNQQSAEIDLTTPSSDPQTAAQQILAESGTPAVPVMTRQDITGRNAQQLAYRNAATAAKVALNNLSSLDSETGQYSSGSTMGRVYGLESSLGMGGQGATARTEADKASKLLANSLMQASAGSKGSGIKMVEFDAGAVPNADMTDQARTDLIEKNKAAANIQIQRGIISDLYPRMSISNVNAIMDNYEQKNPATLPDGKANPNFMPYTQWLASGRPNTAINALNNPGGTSDRLSSVTGTNIPGSSNSSLLQQLLAEKARRQGGQ